MKHYIFYENIKLGIFTWLNDESSDATADHFGTLPLVTTL